MKQEKVIVGVGVFSLECRSKLSGYPGHPDIDSRNQCEKRKNGNQQPKSTPAVFGNPERLRNQQEMP
jgi:hypothetical protein